MKVEKQFVGTHGQNEVAFGFCYLLGFQLMPRLKNIYAQRLARPETGNPGAYPNLQVILSQPINWELIKEQYDQMIKYATALRLGTAETESILRRFNQTGVRHPTYRAFAELGRAIKTIFLYVTWNTAHQQRKTDLFFSFFHQRKTYVPRKRSPVKAA